MILCILIAVRTYVAQKYGETRRLDFTTEAFNLFNHPNVLGVNPFYGSGPLPLPGFGTAASLAAPRQIRFSIDLEF